MITKLYYDDIGRITSAAVLMPENDEQGPSQEVRPFIVVDALPPPGESYVVDGAVQPRPLPSAKISDNQLFDLPVPCTIYVGAAGQPIQAFPCSDTTATLNLPPGDYRVVVEAWPQLNREFKVRI